ncbi:GTP 3',8-cyclase MoaA [Oribacterium sp. WCC10]|uniref:GTP 3',8-cyclase MoaA n=1 Tax=Oribacterium sp. WCC10 TaxID=1855343 RepID=UPI0008E7CF98|nr:GTP 3',8-cyclase MoaA [Oribacterium sp. WCC10]SFG29593.1 cyclic pyranopterin phosphate synthase [Oribacterium sp. WCC10]
MLDRFNRTIDYMRMSITDCCNLRCRYCMPNGMKVPKVPMPEVLSYEQLLEIAEAAVTCGITKFKVTGGEPLVRKDCADFVGRLKRLPGVEQVTMTTNGVLLKENIDKLKLAGLDAVNISLDTLRPEVFRDITGFDKHRDVIEGMEEALAAGIRVKINTVLQRGMNDQEWLQLAGIAKEKPVDVRFIEMMPIGYGKKFDVIYNEELQDRLEQIFPDMEEDVSIHGNGPARYVRIPGFMGSIGFISAIHGKFCSECNRIRLTVTGKLKPCLCYGETYDIREVFASYAGVDTGAYEKRQDELVSLIRKSVLEKPEAHCFEKLAEITETREMIEIGG